VHALVITSASTVAALPAVQAKIEERLRTYARQADGAFAANTARAIAGDTKAFAAFCATLGASPLPAALASITAFLDACAGLGHKPATLRRRLSSLAHMHRAAGLDDPTKAAEVRLCLRRLARQLPGRQRQAAPIGEAEVAQIIAAVGAKPGLRQLRDTALLLVCRDLLARRSEVVALDLADLEDAGDGTSRALIRRSKTDQEGHGAVGFVGRRASFWLKRWCQAAGITSGPVFRALAKGGRLGGRLRAPDVAVIFKELAELAGLDPTLVSGHSCRVGMCQDLIGAGYELGGIMQAGRWRSPSMVARYGERLAAGKGVVAQYEGRRGG